MAVNRPVLELYKEITAGNTDATQTFTPAAKEFKITHIEGQAAFDLNCVVKLEFDGVLVWHTKGASTRTKPIELTGDGVKILKLVLDATDLGSGTVLLGGRVEIEQEL